MTDDPNTVRIVFMGSPEFAVPSLRALAGQGYRLVGIITQPDRPAGRGARITPPAVKPAALELGLPVVQPVSLRDPAAQAALAGLRPELLLVAAFGQILPRAVLDIPRLGAINVHASLLPRWRGASPIASAILAGDSETGVSIMQLVAKMDAGPVIARAATPIVEHETTGELDARLAILGAATLVDTLPRWLRGELEPQPQDDGLATYCSLIRKQDGHLRATWPLERVERAVRAYNPWPGASVGYRGARLAIWTGHCNAGVQRETGSLVIHEGQPAIAFQGGLLMLDEVQRSGSRRLTGREFLNGEHGRLPAAVELE